MYVCICFGGGAKNVKNCNIRKCKTHTHLIFFLMCAGLAGFGGLDRFEGLEGLVSLEAFCFFDLLECVLL